MSTSLHLSVLDVSDAGALVRREERIPLGDVSSRVPVFEFRDSYAVLRREESWYTWDELERRARQGAPWKQTCARARALWAKLAARESQRSESVSVLMPNDPSPCSHPHATSYGGRPGSGDAVRWCPDCGALRTEELSPEMKAFAEANPKAHIPRTVYTFGEWRIPGPPQRSA